MTRAGIGPRVASLVILVLLLAAWQLATQPGKAGDKPADEYARLAGQGAVQMQRNPLPSPAEVAQRAWLLGSHALDRDNPNNLGIAWHLAFSMMRVALGFALAFVVAVPLGFVVGLIPSAHQALNPFIQILRPVSPLAWMPLALYTFKDSGVATIFIIFICAIWPMLINTAAGAAAVRPEWTNVSRVVGLGPLQHVRRVALPASIPMILTGVRLSIGIAWFVIVAAEMVGAQSGIGYFIWNEWNNLQISSMIVAIGLIGTIGFVLDVGLKSLGDRLSYKD